MTEANTVFVNGSRIRSRLLVLEMSERDLARQTDIGQSAIRGLLRNHQAHTSLTIAQVQALAREVGLTVAEVLTPDEHTTDDAANSDEAFDDQDMARRLIAVLLQDKRIIAWDHLIDAFHSTRKDLRRAASAANKSLRGTGLRVHMADSGLALRTEEQPVREVIASIERLRARSDSMDKGTARVLYEVVTGSIAQGQIKKGYGPRLGYLHNQGMVHVGRPGKKFIVPSEDVAFAFDV